MEVNHHQVRPPKCNNCDNEDDPKRVRVIIRKDAETIIWTRCPNHECTLEGVYEE